MVLCLPVAPAARSPGAQMRGKADSTRLARMDWEGPVPAQGVEAYSVVRKHVTWRQAGICSPASRRPPGAHCGPVWEAHCLCSPPARPPGPGQRQVLRSVASGFMAVVAPGGRV